MSFAVPFRLYSPPLLLFICALSVSLLQVGAFKIKHDDDEGGYTYGVIVDCGSSGTRAHIFKWDNSLGYPELLNDIEPMRDRDGVSITKTIKPGLSSLKDDPRGASRYMQPIFEFISANIPEESHSFTGIYILGTAGMRLLDEDTQMKIMDDIASDLETNYNFPKVKTSVITGAEEGMYQWITVNSKARRFITGSTVRHEKPRTYGLLEMGGASLQVTYQVLPGMDVYINDLLAHSPEAQAALRNLFIEPRISRKSERYQLVSATFLGFGSNSIREAYVDMLIMGKERRARKSRGPATDNSSPRTTVAASGQLALPGSPYIIQDPCLPVGAVENMIRPLKMFSAIGNGQTIGFTIDNDDATFQVEIHGKGQYSSCRANMRQLLQTAKKERFNCKPGKSCTMSLIGTPFVPAFSFGFLGVGDFYYTTKEMMNQSGKYNRQKVVEKTKDICRTPYDKLQELYPEANKNDKTRILRECFKAIWLEVFLTMGLRFPENFDALEMVKKIRGDDLDWTLGAVLDKSLAIERKILRWSFRPTDTI